METPGFFGHLLQNLSGPYRIVEGVARRHPVLSLFIACMVALGALLNEELPAALRAALILGVCPAAGALLADLASVVVPGTPSWSRADAYARWGGVGALGAFLAPLLVAGSVAAVGGRPEVLVGSAFGRALVPVVGYLTGVVVEALFERTQRPDKLARELRRELERAGSGRFDRP